MTELKTLKNFESHSWAGHKCIIEKELKAEAVKWIDKPRTLRMNANDFILVFFNLTEEDLQEEKEE